MGIKLSEARDIKQELRAFYAKLNAIAAKSNGQMVPQTETIVQLKLKMMELYQKLGVSAIQAEYHTLVQCGEFDKLGHVLSVMLLEGQLKMTKQAHWSLQTASDAARNKTV